MSGPKQRHPRQEGYPRLRQGSSYVWKLEPGTQHLAALKQPLCVSLASPSSPLAWGEHLKEFVKLTRGDIKYSEILR